MIQELQYSGVVFVGIGLLLTICQRSFISITTRAEPRLERDKNSAFRRHLGTRDLIRLNES